MDLYLFSILFSLLLALLLGMLMVWVWTLGRIWSGRPLLADVPCFPLREAPWGAMTVFSVVVLYLLVNVAVSRVMPRRRADIPASKPSRPSRAGSRSRSACRREAKVGDDPDGTIANRSPHSACDDQRAPRHPGAAAGAIHRHGPGLPTSG